MNSLELGASVPTEQRIRSLFRAQMLLIVGGDHREQAVQRLRDDLELRDVVHCPTRQSNSSARSFASQLHAPDILLVVWVCGLSRTNHGRVVHQQCRGPALPWIDCMRIPHPHTLVAEIERLHLVAALRARHDLVAQIGFGPNGGAA
ncbi:MAG: hypothetical protein HZB39_18545 [Planctomycetes bacterium]|nr:hypothetical protein [Planctomycetota bacterium]